MSSYIFVYWTDAPPASPSDYLAWVHMGGTFLGILGMDAETATEFHNALGDGRVNEQDWDHVLV